MTTEKPDEIGCTAKSLRLTIDILGHDGRVRSFEALEAEIFRLAVLHNDYSVDAAARDLGVGRTTIYRKLKAAGMPPSEWRPEASYLAPRHDRLLDALSQPRTAAELRREFGVSKQAIYEVLGKLLRAGAIERRVCTSGIAHWTYVRANEGDASK